MALIAFPPLYLPLQQLQGESVEQHLQDSCVITARSSTVKLSGLTQMGDPDWPVRGCRVGGCGEKMSD